METALAWSTLSRRRSASAGTDGAAHRFLLAYQRARRAIGALRLLPADRPRAAVARLDVPGAVLATLGVTALVYGLTRAEADGWSAPATLVGSAVGVTALIAFMLVEARWAASPLLPPRLLRRRPVWSGNLVVLAAGACFIPMWYFLSLYMQDVLHYGALATGLGFLPHTLAGVATARLAPAAMRRTGARTLIICSALLSAAGFWWQSRIDETSGYLDGLLGPAILMSAGMGLLVPRSPPPPPPASARTTRARLPG